MASDDESDLFDDDGTREPSEPDQDMDQDQDQERDDDQDEDNADQDMEEADESDEGSGGDEEGDGEGEGEDDDGDAESDATGATQEVDEQEDEDEQDDESLPMQSPERAPPRAMSHPPAPGPPVPDPNASPSRASLAPDIARRVSLYHPAPYSRSFTIEPLAAMPHPIATHCLATSLCMSHLLTGSEDGYIRNYDLFGTCNSKVYLSQPQRQHCGLGDSNIRAGILRFWFDGLRGPASEGSAPSPIYSMTAHSDALWCLAGNAEGSIALHTLRHTPGQVVHVLKGHRKAVSSLALQPDEKGVFSAGWDHIGIHWDLNTGQQTRQFQGHTAQLAAITVRPTAPAIAPASVPVQDDDAGSDHSLDDLFDAPDDDDSNPGSRRNSTAANGYTLSLPGAQPSGSGHASSSHAGRGIRPMSPHSYADYSPDMLLTASIDGQVVIWDRRQRERAGRLDMGDRCPPWCISACWSADGSQVYAGRRNGTIDVWDVRQIGTRGQTTPRVLKILRNPPSSGLVSCIAPFPDGRHLVCASQDNIRLWNVHEADKPKTLGFKIIAGHHGGTISQMIVDRNSQFLITASGDRGWFGDSTKTVLVHDIKPLN